MTETSSELLGIGEAARRAGVAPSTLRYYESAGLLPAPARRSGRRRYEPDVVQRLAVIDAAKRAGFTLEEIRELLDGLDGALPSAQRWQAMAARKLPEIDAVIRDAQRVRRLLVEGISSVRLAGRPFGYPSPFAYRRGPGFTLVTLLFDTLLWRMPSGELRPWLAARWEASEDATTQRFTLRDDVRWHDGRPLTAADVAFTFELLLARGQGGAELVQVRGLDVVEGVEARGSHEVVVRLSRPCAAFGDLVAGRVPILPAHVWRGVEDPAGMRGDEATLGTGPYRLESCEEERGHYRLVADEGYFLGPPRLQRLEWVPVADQLAALEQGEIDAAIYVSDGGRPTGTRLAAFEGADYRVGRRPGEWTRTLQFDLRAPSVFADRRVRHALAHALDRDGMVTRLLEGAGRRASTGGLAPTHPHLAPGLPAYEHDPARARGLLDAAGLEAGRDGTRVGPDGAPLRVRLLTDRADPGAAELVRADLGRVGIEVTVSRRSPAEADEAAARGAFDLALVGHGGLGGDPEQLRLRLSARIPVRARTHAHGYDSQRFEKIALAQSGELDPERRAALVAELQHVVADDLPFLPLYVPDQLTITPVKQIFTAWHPTKGGVWGGYPGPLNKWSFVSGE